MLNISNTPLTQVPMSICQLKKLKFLHLDANRLHRLPDNCFTNMVALRNLSARQNKITALQNGLFDGLNSLVVVDFSLNKIASIGLHVFSNPNDLVNLRRIALDNNRLRSLEPWPYIRGLHGSRASKVHISINANFISEFTNGIKWQFSCSRPSYAILNITGNYVRHFNSIPYGWNVSAPEWKCTMYPNSDQFRSPAFEVVFALSHNYHCDCVDMPYIILATFDDTYHMYKSVRCNQPLSLANRSVMDVGWDKFVCEMPKGCPLSCRCVYRPFNCTLHVYCSAGNLSSLPLDLPPLPGYYGQVTYNLDFSNNKLLKRLDYRPYFANTSILDVSNCAIDVVDLNVLREFPTMLSQLQNCNFFPQKSVKPEHFPKAFLHGNKIESLSSDVTGINLTSVRLTLNDNPWKCSCDNRWMIAWFKSLSSRTSSNIGDVLCSSPSRLKGRSILHADEVEFCSDPLTRMLKIVLSSTLSAVAGFLVLGFAIYRLRVRIHRRWKFHPFDRDECDGEDMDYDVFLCCSSDDNTPHGLRILQLMETKGYRVCYHLRDFLAGEPITENMLQSIVHSKRTVCFISSNFLRR